MVINVMPIRPFTPVADIAFCSMPTLNTVAISGKICSKVSLMIFR